MHLSHSLARWSLEVDIDKYHHLIPVCLLGLTVFEKMQCQINRDIQIMMNKCNKCLPLSVITLPPHRGGQKSYRGRNKKICARSLQYLPLPWKKPIVRKQYLKGVHLSINRGYRNNQNSFRVIYL